MHTYMFRTGEIVLKAETPEKLVVKEPYSLFLCDEKNFDVSVRFHYLHAFETPVGTLLKQTDSEDVYVTDDEYHFYYHVTGDRKYYAIRKVKKSLPSHHDVYLAEENRGKLWTRLVFSLINFEDIAAFCNASIFHASFTDTGSGAVLFTAPCGTGKSTQAALWQKYRNAETINGDKVLIYEKDGIWYAAGLPFSGSSDICKNRILPIKAVVRLSQAKENKLTRLNGFAAYRAVYEGCYHSKWSGDLNRVTDGIAAGVAEKLPVIHLACLPDESAVCALESFIENI